MASMKLILLQDVEDLGLAGEEVHVAPGYARNYLIPRKLAAVATTAALRQLAARKEKIEEQRKAELEAAQNIAAKLQELAVELHLQASDDGHLFGSVTDRMIADAIASLGVTVPHQRIHLDSQIRSCGEYVVAVKLHQKVIVDVKVNVVRA